MRDRLWTRCGGHDEITGQPLDYDTFDLHHRRPKGMGGTTRPDRDWPSNLLALAPEVHNFTAGRSAALTVHGNPEWSRPLGYLVAKDTPWASAIPVLIRARYWMFLGDDARYYPAPPGLTMPPVARQG
jgi:hypothetical protein